MTVKVTRPGTEVQAITNPADVSDLGQSKYDFNYLAFPSDIGMDNMGHYMVININVPTNYKRTVAGNLYNGDFDITPLETTSRVDILRGTGGTYLPVTTSGNIGAGVWNTVKGAFGYGETPKPTNSNAVVIPRFTKRIAESVALYMPTPLVFNHQNEYQEVSLTALAGAIGSTYGAGAIGGAIGGGAGLAVAAGIGALTSSYGELAGTAAKIMQRPINPAVEVLFSNTVLRSFVFEVLMAPRNAYESETIRKIVRTMKFHGAPELGALGGLMWIPPAEFDITFFNKGTENLNILRINTCVLERIEIDYAPTGIYSTFRNGHPVAVRLSMAFRELEPIHKQRVTQGF